MISNRVGQNPIQTKPIGLGWVFKLNWVGLDRVEKLNLRLG